MNQLMKRRQSLHPYTIIINKAQKQASKLGRNQALAWLAAQFPDAFDNTLRIRPLKIGIMHDILQYAGIALSHGISKNKLRQAVAIYTRSLDYLMCLKAQEMRIDLRGNATCFVTLNESKHAAYQVKKLTEKSIFMHTKHTTSSPNQTVSIKHKTTKSYDLTTVARLKAKLGLDTI